MSLRNLFRSEENLQNVYISVSGPQWGAVTWRQEAGPHKINYYIFKVKT